MLSPEAPHHGHADTPPGAPGPDEGRYASDSLTLERQGAARRGIALALTATVLWSTTSLFIDRLSSAYPITPLAISAWRSGLVAVLLITFMAVRRRGFRLSAAEVPYLALYGLFGIALFNLTWAESVTINKAAVATALVFSGPAFVAVGDRLLFGEALTRLRLAAIAACLTGCALVAELYHPADVLRNPAGLLLGLGSGMVFAVYTLFGKSTVRRVRRGSLTITMYIFTFAAASLWLLGALGGDKTLWLPPLDRTGWLLLVGLSAGPTLFGYALFTSSLRYLPATVASLLTTLEPPLAALLAIPLLGRTMSAPQWLGTALIVCAVATVRAGRGK